MKQYSKELLTELYKKMLLTRYFEEKVAYLFQMGQVHGTTHLCIGEEASCVGSITALEPEDIVVGNHRGHGSCVAKGMDINLMMAELLGKETGYCKGKGGSMHIADIANNNLGANGVVGGGFPLAVGAALTIKMKKEKRVAVCMFGDGSTNTGNFHEALNLASIWKLPVIFVCENNLYAMSTHISRNTNISDLSLRAASYGMIGKKNDGNDVMAVYESVKEARAYVLGNGPILIVNNTYRITGHSKSDANVYRTKEEINEWRQKCPIKKMRGDLFSSGIFSEEELCKIEDDAHNTIESALKFAQDSKYPDISTIYDDVYA